jgi:hypothetical protein
MLAPPALQNVCSCEGGGGAEGRGETGAASRPSLQLHSAADHLTRNQKRAAYPPFFHGLALSPGCYLDVGCLVVIPHWPLAPEQLYHLPTHYS